MSLYVKGNRMSQTNDHRKNTRDKGGIFSIKANLPTIKLPAQNNAERVNNKYAKFFFDKRLLTKSF